MKHSKETFWGYFLVIPTIVGISILNIYPFFKTIKMSFFKSGYFGNNDVFIGFQNFGRLIKDIQVWQALLNTLKYMVLVVPISVILSLFIATLLNKRIKGISVYRVIIFLPMISAPAAVAMVWKWIFNERFGLLNKALGLFNISEINWVNNPSIAMYSIAIIGIWSTVGYNSILLLSGLQEIPKDYYEVAELDGASSFKRFFHVTLPLLSPNIFFVLVINVIQAIQVFDIIFMMVDITSPAYGKTVSLVYLFYDNTFKYDEKGYGSAIVLLLLVVVGFITMIQTKIQKKWVYFR